MADAVGPDPSRDLDLTDHLAVIIADAYQVHDHNGPPDLDGYHCVPCWLTARNVAPRILAFLRDETRALTERGPADRRYPPEPTPEEWAALALEDDRPALEAHRDALKREQT